MEIPPINLNPRGLIAALEAEREAQRPAVAALLQRAAASLRHTDPAPIRQEEEDQA
jgi:hypothetical protein